MSTSAGHRKKETHVLNFFYDKDDGSAITVLVNGVRFHAYVDFALLKDSADKDDEAVQEYSRLINALRDHEKQQENQEKDNTRSRSTDPDAEYGQDDKQSPESQDDQEIFCLCRGPESGFMIGCDSCDQWYHGACVDISPDQKDNIGEYICPRCKEDNNRNTKASSQDSGIVLQDEDNEDPETALQNWMIKSLEPELDRHAPSRREKKQVSVQEWYNPPTKFYSLESSNNRISPVELDATPELEQRMSSLPPQLTMPKYILDLNLPRISATDLLVTAESDFPEPYHPCLVSHNKNSYFLKVVDPTQPNPTKREIKLLHRIQNLGLQTSIRVPKIHALISFSNSPKSQILGFLQTEIAQAEPLTHLLDPSIRQPKRDAWALSCKNFVQELHKHNIIWGDAKADNFMVDKDDQVWIIDFGGSFTEGWVEEEVKETREGDEMGLGKVVGALKDPEENTVDLDEDDEKDGGGKRKCLSGLEEREGSKRVKVD